MYSAGQKTRSNVGWSKPRENATFDHIFWPAEYMKYYITSGLSFLQELNHCSVSSVISFNMFAQVSPPLITSRTLLDWLMRHTAQDCGAMWPKSWLNRNRNLLQFNGSFGRLQIRRGGGSGNQLLLSAKIPFIAPMAGCSWYGSNTSPMTHYSHLPKYLGIRFPSASAIFTYCPRLLF